jgi:hypothetical protein
MGWLALLLVAGAAALAVVIANACVKRGWRLLGVLSSFVIGGISVYTGYSFGFEGSTELRSDGVYTITYPVVGWIGMIGGGLIAFLGTWTSLVATKEGIELWEYQKKQETDFDRKLRDEVKECAKAILESGRIDDYKRYNNTVKFLSELDVSDVEAELLLTRLEALK